VSALVKTYAEGNERKNRPTSDEDILVVDEAPAATAEDELLAS